jgi:flavin reductase (DIM6/NTAB) family NADH-FMN oxidoreductase RutF
MKDISYNELAQETLETLSKGAFLTTADGNTVNTMTIAWGSTGFMWGKPVFMAMVRPSRYTHGLLEKNGEFTVTFPRGNCKEALALCGSKSGRDMDKLTAANLKTLPGKTLATPIIACPGIHYECKIVHTEQMTAENLETNHKEKWYATGDYHTLYFAEILSSYITD